jgi:hypothetical protein
VVEHVNLVGRYHIALAETIVRGDYRALNSPISMDAANA